MGAVNFSLDRHLVDALQSALPFSVLVETGTFEGDTLANLEECFDFLHSIELSPQYFQAAQARFSGHSKIHLYQGDSAAMLRQIRSGLPDDGVLFFFDAHWCVASNTAGESSQCPLLEEIAAVGHLGNGSAIVIDDARLFLAPPLAPHEISQWPTFQHVVNCLFNVSSEHELIVVNDVIIFFPSLSKLAMYKYAQLYGIDWLEVTSKAKENQYLREQFEDVCKQNLAKEAEVRRLINEVRQMRWMEPLPAVADVSALPEVDSETKENDTQLELIRKERVIRELACALKAYRATFWVLRPILRPVSFLTRHARAALRPRLGNLNQHPPIELVLPPPFISRLPADKLPTISIVTPSFQQARFLGRTIDSVLGQNYPKLEYFVQDGGSTDGTLEVLNSYADQLTGWVSDKDGGQSHAINLGFAGTNSEIMAWLNSDDLLLPGALHRIGEYFAQHPEVDVVYGHRILIDEEDKEIGRWVLPAHDNEVLSWADFVPQETLFWRRSIWKKAGGQIDDYFKFAMDWDLLLRFRKAGAKMVRLPYFLGAFRIHGAQKTSAVINEVGMREMDILRQRELKRLPSRAETRRAIMPYVGRHVASHVWHRLKVRLGVMN